MIIFFALGAPANFLHWRPEVQLGLSAVAIIFAAGFLGRATEAVAHCAGQRLGAVFGNAAKHSAAVLLAMKNKMGAAEEIAVGSSLQIALFVAPVLVFISLPFTQQTDLIFTTIELAAIAAAVLIANSTSRDGSTARFEGVLLLVVYCILGVSFFFV